MADVWKLINLYGRRIGGDRGTRSFGAALTNLPVRPMMHKLAKRESDQSRAKQHKTRNGHSEEAVRSELLTHGAPPNRASRALHEGNDCPVAQSKELPFDVQFRSRLMFWCNTCYFGHDEPPINTVKRLRISSANLLRSVVNSFDSARWSR
jgi:hypothetical protein